MTIWPSCVMQRAGDDLVLEVEVQLALRRQVWSRLATLLAYSRLAWKGIWLGRLSVPSIVTPSRVGDCAGLGQLAVAAGLGREVDDHRARAHRA